MKPLLSKINMFSVLLMNTVCFLGREVGNSGKKTGRNISLTYRFPFRSYRPRLPAGRLPAFVFESKLIQGINFLNRKVN
jgi:hypothetical protein